MTFENVGAQGTPFFMAPELLMGGKISVESDVYAFGVTVWEVIAQQYKCETTLN